MHLLGPSLLLLANILEYLAFSDSSKWRVEHPHTLYSWEGACVWIPCTYTVYSGRKDELEELIVYRNYKYDEATKSFEGLILYNDTKPWKGPDPLERVQFLGDQRSNCTIHINPVLEEDDGWLGLRMIKKNSKWMERIDLNVSKTPLPLQIQLPPEIQEFREATLTCLLNFSCPGYNIQLQWSLEGDPGGSLKERAITLTSLTTKTISTQSKLTFQPRWTQHGKNLTCQLWDRKAEQMLSKATVLLDVKHVPKLKIEGSPKEVNVTEGESVTVTCQVISSNPEVRNIAWLKDGTRLREQKTSTLTLFSVTKKMSGKYQCEAFNDVGSGRSDAVVLQVYYAPEPSRVEIFSSTAKEGDQVVMTCMSLANPPPTNYTWYYNGVAVPGRTSKIFQIPAVLLSQAGKYSCMAENRLGSSQIGQETELDVQYAPKEVTTVIENPMRIQEGDTVTLSCNYSSSNPGVTQYVWNFQGSQMKQPHEVLIIQKVAWNTRPITCAACNQWCSWAPIVNLDVQYAPKDVRVQQIIPSSEIRSGNRVRLECNFSSSRPRDVRFFWKKNGIFLKEGKELSFDSVSPEDAGNYNCFVNNSIGQTMSEARTLQVLYAPRMLHVAISPKDQVMEGKKAILTCESDANPPVLQYTWFDWKNQNLHHYDQMLRLDPVKIQHSGAYRCEATNQLGRVQSPPSTLTVYYSPETIGRRVAVGVGFCLATLLLAFWGVKLQRSWKRIRSQQGLQESSSGQSFFVRKQKVRRAPLSEEPNSLGCYNPVMEDAVSYAALRFPVGDNDTPRTGGSGSSKQEEFMQKSSSAAIHPPSFRDARTLETEGPSPNTDDTVTYSVLKKCRVGDYENVLPNSPEDEGIHYSELVHLGVGERPQAQEAVEYVTLKH
ncbi:B-cell receptor CD22 isoform X1 [Mustela nigripes]|uniref:B-cell receptor CD22 isoform X1 n=1 Tax=Mustela nigripes TaxID=77151 RepID=UPI00281524CE|nr:B-cell receptor CD22 isoform X1 [Mustela nigripes]